MTVRSTVGDNDATNIWLGNSCGLIVLTFAAVLDVQLKDSEKLDQHDWSPAVHDWPAAQEGTKSERAYTCGF